jgi:hypothetical protein
VIPYKDRLESFLGSLLGVITPDVRRKIASRSYRLSGP